MNNMKRRTPNTAQCPGFFSEKQDQGKRGYLSAINRAALIPNQINGLSIVSTFEKRESKAMLRTLEIKK